MRVLRCDIPYELGAGVILDRYTVLSLSTLEYNEEASIEQAGRISSPRNSPIDIRDQDTSSQCSSGNNISCFDSIRPMISTQNREKSLDQIQSPNLHLARIQRIMTMDQIWLHVHYTFK